MMFHQVLQVEAPENAKGMSSDALDGVAVVKASFKDSLPVAALSCDTLPTNRRPRPADLNVLI